MGAVTQVVTEGVTEAVFVTIGPQEVIRGHGVEPVVEHMEEDFIIPRVNRSSESNRLDTMEPWVAYLIVSIGALLVLYFAYVSYQSYKKSPSRWVLREVATEWALRLWK